MRKLHWLAWQPTPYNDLLFAAVARTLDLTVHYRSRVVPSHPWQSSLAQGYRARFYRTRFGVDWHVVSRVWREGQAFFVVGGWDHPTGQLLLTLLRLGRRAYAVWTDVPAPSRRRRRVVAAVRARWLRWIMNGATRVMGTGAPGVNGLAAMGAPADRLVNFPYWVDVAALHRMPSRRARGAPLVLISSGRLVKGLKGHDIALRALAQVKAAGASAFEYRIAGAGPDEAGLRALSESLGLADCVKFLGWLEPEALRQLYGEADVLLHPSPVHEPYGVAVLEAMAAGLVVFASDATQAAVDRVEHGRNGFMHRAGDELQLAEQLGGLMRRPAAIAEIAACAMETAAAWPVERGVALVQDVVSAAAPGVR